MLGDWLDYLLKLGPFVTWLFVEIGSICPRFLYKNIRQFLRKLYQNAEQMLKIRTSLEHFFGFKLKKLRKSEGFQNLGGNDVIITNDKRCQSIIWTLSWKNSIKMREGLKSHYRINYDIRRSRYLKLTFPRILPPPFWDFFTNCKIVFPNYSEAQFELLWKTRTTPRKSEFLNNKKTDIHPRNKFQNFSQ